jgi:hypothetical protein
MSDILENNILAITVNDSIVAGITDNAVDFTKPLSFTEWLVRTNPTETDNSYLISQYKMYLLAWYKVKNLDTKNTEDFVRSSFISLLREILLNYSTLEERRFVSNADFNNDLELYSVLPFFVKKIKEICNYYALLRQNVSFKKYENSLKGSQGGVISVLKNAIYKNLQATQISSAESNLVDLSAFKNNLTLEIKELFDDSQYFDLNPSLPATTYNPTFTSQFYSSNLNELDATLYTNFDQSIIDAIKTYPFFLNDFKTPYSINVQVQATDLAYLRDKDFINQINNQDKTNLNLNLEKELIEKFIGTDYYYVSTGSTITDFTSGVLFQAQDKAANSLNKRFPSVASVQNEENLKNIREIGGFFLPDRLGVLNFNNFKYTVQIDETQLKPNKVYIFPDPYKYGNISNLSLTDFESPLIYEEDVTWMHYNRTAQFLFGNVVSNPLYKDFYAYHSRSQTVGYEPYGMSRDIDSTEFFEGSGKDVWANSDVFPVTENVLPLEDRQFNLLAINKTLIKYKSDIYSNNYGLFKEINPVGVGPDGSNQGDFISADELNFFNFTGGRGGLNGTGRKGLTYNQFDEIKSTRKKPCMILDGYLFFDIDEGYNFNFAIPNAAKRVSGVYTRTITQIPPGSGYFTSGPGILSASPTPYANYGIAYPYSAPPSFRPLPSPLLLVAYGKGHFIPDDFCDVNTVNYCLLLDCVTFVDALSNLRLDVSSDSSAWSTSVPVYYSELLEGSLTTTYTKPNNVERATFSYTYPASAQVIQELNGYRFNLQGQTPCAVTNSNTSPRVDYNVDTASFVNLPVPPAYATQVQDLSTNSIGSKTIYSGRNEILGEMYYKNANTARVDLIQNALSAVFMKYPVEVRDSINKGVVNFDLIFNVIFIETADYFVVDKLDYNYEENAVEPYNSDKNFLSTFIVNKSVEKISNIFYNEKLNEAVFTRLVLLPTMSASNLKIIYPEVYKIDITNPTLKKLYPNFELNYNNLSSFIHIDADTNIDRIDKPIMTFNEDSKTYLINYLAKDSNNVFFNVFEEFQIVNSDVIFLQMVFYKPEYFIKDYNFTIVNAVTALQNNSIAGVLSSYQNTNTNTYWFCMSTEPVAIVPEYVACAYGVVFEPVISPDPTPSITPTVTPTPTPTPAPTPTSVPWTNTCTTYSVKVTGAGTSAVYGIYVLSAGATTFFSPSAQFTVFYQSTSDSSFFLIGDNSYPGDSTILKGAILSAVSSDHTLLYASTGLVLDYACVPYGTYDVTSGIDPVYLKTQNLSGVPPYPTVSFYSMT